MLDGGERVRLIGVDTPETVHPRKPVERFGKEASAFTRRIAEGKEVYLEYEGGSSRRDRYDRTLAYVYLPDGMLLNLEIIRMGYGHAYTRFPFSKMEEFRAAEREAREAERGLWADDETQGASGGPSAVDRAEQGDLGGGRAGQGVVPPQASPSASCIPRSQCCKICRKGQACGNSCISASYTCHKGRGCACDAVEVCR